MTRASRLKSDDLGKYEGSVWLGLGKFGPRNVGADKARHTEPTIQAPDALPVGSCRIPLVPIVEETGALVSLLVWLAFGAVAVAPRSRS
jgi:hypothetical protein